MKFLLVLAVVLVAFWVWRNNRSQDLDRDQAPGPRKPLAPVAMVACLPVSYTHLTLPTKRIV